VHVLCLTELSAEFINGFHYPISGQMIIAPSVRVYQDRADHAAALKDVESYIKLFDGGEVFLPRLHLLKNLPRVFFAILCDRRRGLVSIQ
jgi:hypothetical protein